MSFSNLAFPQISTHPLTVVAIGGLEPGLLWCGRRRPGARLEGGVSWRGVGETPDRPADQPEHEHQGGYQTGAQAAQHGADCAYLQMERLMGKVGILAVFWSF